MSCCPLLRFQGGFFISRKTKSGRVDKRTPPAIRGMISLPNIIEKTGVPRPFFLSHDFYLERKGKFLYVPRSKINELKKEYAQSRSALPLESVAPPQVLIPYKKAVQIIGCPDSYAPLCEATVKRGTRRPRSYVPKEEIASIKAQYNSFIAEMSRDNALVEKIMSMVNDAIAGLNKKYDALIAGGKTDGALADKIQHILGNEIAKLGIKQPIVLGIDGNTAGTAIIADLEKRIHDLEKRIRNLESKGGEYVRSLLSQSLEGYVNKLLETRLRPFKDDINNQLAYLSGQAKKELMAEFDKLVVAANERSLGDLKGDYYRGARLADLAKTYRYLSHPLAVLDKLCFADAQFNRSLRWIIGEKPGSLQMQAVEGIYKLLDYIKTNAEEFDGNIKASFIEAVSNCECFDRKELGKLFSDCKRSVESWALISPRGNYSRIFDLINSINEVGK